MPAHAYFSTVWGHLEPVLDLLDEVAARSAAKHAEVGNQRAHRPHWSDSMVDAAVEAGTVVVGRLRMRPGQSWEGGVDGPGGYIRVTGAAALNRALHGDTVAVQLLGSCSESSDLMDLPGMNA